VLDMPEHMRHGAGVEAGAVVDDLERQAASRRHLQRQRNVRLIDDPQVTDFQSRRTSRQVFVHPVVHDDDVGVEERRARLDLAEFLDVREEDRGKRFAGDVTCLHVGQPH
jgi:hypothetical protein